MLKKNKIDKKEGATEEFKIFENCQCIPSCASLDYIVETSQADYHWVQSIVASDFFDLLGNE